MNKGQERTGGMFVMTRNLRLTVLVIGLLSMVVVGGCLLKRPGEIGPPEEPPEFLLAPLTPEHQALINSLKDRNLVFIFQPEVGKLDEVDAMIKVERGIDYGDTSFDWEPFNQHKHHFESSVPNVIQGPAADRWALLVRPWAPKGNFFIDYCFESSKIKEADKIVIGVELRKHNANQWNQLRYSFDGETWQWVELEGEWTWKSLYVEVIPPADTDKIILRWAFLKPHEDGPFWQVGMGNLFAAGYKE